MSARNNHIEKTPFSWADPLGFEDALTDDERMLAETARRFCEDKLMPRVRDDFRSDHPGGTGQQLHPGFGTAYPELDCQRRCPGISG